MSNYGSGMNQLARDPGQGLVPERKAGSMEGTISGALRGIRDALDRLDGTLGDLVGRISPVTAGEAPRGPDTPGPAEQSMSPLHDELISLELRINNMRRNIESVALRITL